MVDKVSWSTRSAALRAFLEKRELRKLKSRGVRSPSKPCKAVPSAEESESCRAEKKEMAKARSREYMRARRAFRKGHPAFKEVDRLAYNAAMRRYRAARAQRDPAFLEACRAANRENARRRRARRATNSQEVDET